MNRTATTWLVTGIATVLVWFVQARFAPRLEAGAPPVLLPEEPELFLDDCFI